MHFTHTHSRAENHPRTKLSSVSNYARIQRADPAGIHTIMDIRRCDRDITHSQPISNRDIFFLLAHTNTLKQYRRHSSPTKTRAAVPADRSHEFKNRSRSVSIDLKVTGLVCGLVVDPLCEHYADFRDTRVNSVVSVYYDARNGIACRFYKLQTHDAIGQGHTHTRPQRICERTNEHKMCDPQHAR